MTLDDAAELHAAKTDPRGYVERLPEKVVLDEVQQAPDLLLEDRARKVVGVEVKASRTVGESDFRHLQTLREAVPVGEVCGGGSRER